jgi:hypothetical protein
MSPENDPSKRREGNDDTKVHHYHFAIKKNRLGQRTLIITETISGGESECQRFIEVPEKAVGRVYRIFSKVAKDLDRSLKVFDLEEIRKTSPRAFTPWTAEEDQQLIEDSKHGLSIPELAVKLQRKPGGIKARLKAHEIYVE